MADANARLRPDLTATAVEVDGVAYVDVHDPRRGTSFRFYDFEFALALQLNGQPVASIVEWAAATYGLELTPFGVGEFADRLAELGFLQEQEAVVELVADDFLDDDQPVSQVVSRVVGDATRTPAAQLVPPSPSSSWTPDLEISIEPPPQRALVLASPRELMTEPVGTETLMGFAARVPIHGLDDPPPGSDSGSRINNGETMMGFASVGDEPSPAPPPRATPERRQPPSPDTVQMAPFAEEGLRTERSAPSIATGRRPRPPVAEGRGLSLTAVMWIVVLIAAAAAVGYYIWSQQQGGAEARRVRIVAPRPAAVYRWFDPVGAVVAAEPRALSFSLAGTVGEVLPAGTKLAAGEIAAKLQGAGAREAEVNRHRSRIGYYEQLRDSMKAAGNLAAQRAAEVKLAEKQSLFDEARAALDQLVLRAPEPGEIIEVAARAGTGVAAGSPVVRVKAGALLGQFALPARDAETAVGLGFCRVEVVGGAPTASNAAPPHHGSPASGAADSGSPAAAPPAGAARFADCKVSGGAAARAGKAGKLHVELPAGSELSVGQPLRLARSRFDGVFPVPRAAIVRVGDTDRVYVAGAGGTAEARAVTLAESGAGVGVGAGPDEALVSQGIDVGDQVIADPPPDLRDGEPIQIDKQQP